MAEVEDVVRPPPPTSWLDAPALLPVRPWPAYLDSVLCRAVAGFVAQQQQAQVQVCVCVCFCVPFMLVM